MTLSEHLHDILVKIRDSFDVELPDPMELTHSGEMMVRGHAVTARSSAPLKELSQHEVFTVYLHSRSQEDDREVIRYFHFEGRKDFSFLNIFMSRMPDGSLRQQVEVSTRPLEMALARINRFVKHHSE